tara:strand:+ start:199 stop:954 length:756 start_codon:yes stop_codon:yes gene_type:complete
LIKSKKLKNFRSIKHAFFNRSGGKSGGIYKGLNCGIGSLDNKKDVIKNLNIAKNKIGLSKNNLVLLKQIHSDKFHFIKTSFNFKKKIGDALLTKTKKIGLGILTADCVPILLFDKKEKIIGAIHAGWKGAYKGIIYKVVKFMIKKGCDKKNIIAVIGPCITQSSYEVKKDFKIKFLRKNRKYKSFFKLRNGKTYFSLNKFVYYQLKELGVNNLEIINKNTFDPKNNFYSARRSKKNNDSDYGRNISIIMIN